MSERWYGSRAVLVLASIGLPPLGLVLFWLRPGVGLLQRILGSLLIFGLGVAHLYLFFGLYVELDGTGKYPIISFYRPERHYQALMGSREERHIEAEVEAAPTNGAPEEASPSGTPADEEARPPHPPAPEEMETVESQPVKVRDAYWTDFRGPHRDGHYRQTRILTHWPEQGLKLLWKQPIGGGYASFVIAEGKAFTIEQRRHQEVVTAYEVESGKEVWAYGWEAEFQEAMGGDGPRATPTWDEGRLYALGALGHLACLEADTGQLLWSVNILTDNRTGNLSWGMAASPLVVEEKLIVLPGGRAGSSVVAYHKLTGRPIWKALGDQQAYTSPMRVSLAGREQLLIVSAERAMGLDPEDGSLLWDYPWVTDYGINVAQPLVVGENRFFISAGYGHGAAVVEISREGDRYGAHTVWKNINMKNKFNGSVYHQGYIYGLDEGILACVDAQTGERKWKGGRYGFGQVLLASGHLIVITESGDLVLVKATPEGQEELSRFSAISGKTWNNPALAKGRLLVRNAREMACFDVSTDGGAPEAAKYTTADN